MTRYRKKPVEIDAVQWDGSEESADEIARWTGQAVWKGEDYPDLMAVETLEGDMCAAPGDYIIRGLKGEYYPCREDIFLMSYDLVDEEE